MRTVSLADIVEVVAAHYELPPQRLMVDRGRAATRARHVVFWAARQRGEKLEAIAAAAGGWHHAAVQHGIAAVEQRREDEAELRADLAAIGLALDTIDHAARLAAAPAAPDLSPSAVAARALSSPHVATRLSLAEIRALATTVLVRSEPPEPLTRVVEREVRVPTLPAADAVRRLGSARRKFATEVGGRHERGARDELLAAIDAVTGAYSSPEIGALRHG